MFLKEIYDVVGGELHNYKNIYIDDIKISSKEINNNDLFISINSGYNYINDAINNGAVAIISEKEIDISIPIIIVQSTIIALGKLAKYKRDKYNIPVIAITGSTGKTTTKELVSLLLSSKYNVLKSEKNKNNHIGLPLSLLKLNDSYDLAVLELGMNHLGEIEYLSNICSPDYSIITNIGTAHIGNLGSKKNILKAKLEILSNSNGPLIINGDDKLLKKIKYKKLISVSKRSLKVKNIKYFEDRIEFNIDNISFKFNCPFKYILSDLFIAIKIALLFDIKLIDISKSLLNYKQEKGRLNIYSDKYKIIDDSYNSSYESLINGLKELKKEKNKKIIILGDMLELGDFSKYYHKKINKYLNKIKNKEVLLIGEYTKYIKGIHFNSIDEINKYIENKNLYNYTIYIKGSRAMNLDKISIKK